MMTRGLRTTILSFVVAFATFAPAGGNADTPAITHLTLSAAPVDDTAPVLYAIASGMFLKAGLDVQITAMSSGAAVAGAVSGGSVDIGMSSTLPLISAYAHGVPLVLVAASGLYEDTQQPNGGLLVIKDGPVRSARDLDGKVVSVPSLNDLLAIATRTWIEKNGGDPHSINFVEAPPPMVAASLDGARIAAGAVPNPSMAQDLATGRYRLLAAVIEAIAPRMLTAAWFSSKDFVSKNPDAIARFAQVVARASAYCNDHPDQTIDLVAKFTGIEATTIAHMQRDKYATRLNAADLQPLVDAAAKYSAIATRFDARLMIAQAGR
jgi:NitT/TauT family transport system substrate-binding protein